MALRGGLIDREDVDDCIDAFDKLDQNHSGTLTIEDCYFIPDRVAKLGRNKVLAELSKLESALNEVIFVTLFCPSFLGCCSRLLAGFPSSAVFDNADGLSQSPFPFKDTASVADDVQRKQAQSTHEACISLLYFQNLGHLRGI